MEEQDTLSGLRAKVATVVGETPVEPIYKSWEYAVSEYAAWVTQRSTPSTYTPDMSIKVEFIDMLSGLVDRIDT